MNKTTSLIYCNCSYEQLFADNRKQEIRNSLQQHGTPVTIVSDLCGVMAKNHTAIAHALLADSVHIVACYPRTVLSLIAWRFPHHNTANVVVHNMRTNTAQSILAQLPANTHHGYTATEISYAPDWVSWFPVIDYNRCTACRQCHDYCLFSTYSIANGQVLVNQPENCKTNCPACARLCPAAAIIFPKVEESPINGADITDEEAVKAQIKQNTEQLMGNDVYAALARRKQRKTSRRLFAVQPPDSSE